MLTVALGLELQRPPSDSAFRYFFQHVVVAALWTAIRYLTMAQIPGGAADLDQLICDWKTLRGSIETTLGGGSPFIDQMTLWSEALGELDLEGLLIQADALHTQKPFSATP